VCTSTSSHDHPPLPLLQIHATQDTTTPTRKPWSSTSDVASANIPHHAVATAPTMASTVPPPPPSPVATRPPPTVSSLPPNIISAAHVEQHPNLFTHAPSLSSSFSSVTTGSASSLATTNTGRSSSSNGMSEEDRRLHNMPKPLASKCVEAFIAWGHDHKGNPVAYQQFLRLNLPHYPGVDAEKVRLYMKNICATYHERYIPARARGYKQDFLTWWDKRPGRGRPKKDVTVPSAYALAHHLDPSLAPTRGRGGGFRQNESGAGGGGLAANKPRRRRTPTKRAKAAKATASAARGGGGNNVIRRMSGGGGGGGGGGGRGNYTDEDSDSDNEVYYYGSDFGEIEGEENDDDEDGMDEDNHHRRQQKKKGAVRGFSKSGRAIRRPSDPYLDAVQEEATKRARIEAALAMMEMDDNNGRATGRGPPPPGIRTPSPPLFSTYHGASIYPVRHHGRNALRIDSPVPLTDQDVTNILTDLRSNSFASNSGSNGGGGGGGGEASSSSNNNNHIGANNTIANGDSKMPAPAAAAAMATPCGPSPRSRPPVAPRAIRMGSKPGSTHASPPPCAQALAGLVNLGGARNLGRATSPSSRLVEVNPPAHARPHQHHYVVHPHSHPHAAAGQMYMASAPAAVAAAAPPSTSPMQFLVRSGGPPPQHLGQRHYAHGHAYPQHAHPHANMHGIAQPPVFQQYVYQSQPRNCQDPQCMGCPVPTFLNPPPPPPPAHHHQYRGGGGEGAAHRRH